jgi:hypothetical protein
VASVRPEEVRAMWVSSDWWCGAGIVHVDGLLLRLLPSQKVSAHGLIGWGAGKSAGVARKEGQGSREKVFYSGFKT